MERFMDDDMLVEHGKDTTQMWVKYEDCAQELSLTKADAQATIAALQAQLESANKLIYKKNCDLGRAETIVNDLQSQLTQRTAELEALRKWRDYVTVALQRPGGAFFEDVPKHIIDLVAELERVRGLVKTYADAKIDFDDKRLQEDHHAWRERYNKLVEAENALLQHHQGMEG